LNVLAVVVALSALAVVETQSTAGMWTAIFGAITPLVLLFSLWVQRIWAAGVAKAAAKAASAADEVKRAAVEVKDKLETTSNEQRVSMAIIQQTTSRTYMRVNGQYTLYLRNMAMLARNHANMARQVAKASNNDRDEAVAGAAELMAQSTEADYLAHMQQQDSIENDQTSKIKNAMAVQQEAGA
jgi:hypothetical protein